MSIPVVFSESTICDRAAKQVAKETGAQYGGVLYVDSLSAANGPVPTYADLLEGDRRDDRRRLQLLSELSLSDNRPTEPASSAAVGIAVHDLTVTYRNGHTAIEGATFDLGLGSICGLVGINGSGKSTLFKAIMGFVRPTRGTVQPVRHAGRRRAEAQHRRLRAAERGRRLELPGAGSGRRHDGPLRLHELPAHPVAAGQGEGRPRRSSASA